MIAEITEIIVTDDGMELLRYRAVAVEKYGLDGYSPIYKDDCPLKTSCIGRSGDSVCGGYAGHAGTHVVRCREELTK